MNVNNFGPKSAMGANLAKQVKDLGKLDEKKAVDGVQEATSGDRPQGTTDVDKTVIINYTGDGYETKYDGVDNGVIITLSNGEFHKMGVDEQLHNIYRDEGEGFHPCPTEE